MDLSGIYPPIATPFNADGSVSFEALKANVEKLLEDEPSLAGIVVLGSNGEAALMNEEERFQVIHTVASLVPAKYKIIAGASHDSTHETIRIVNKLAATRVDAVLILPPSYYKSQMTDEVIIGYYTSVADAAKSPVIVYNMPANTGIDLSVNVVVTVSSHPRIIGLKDSSGNVQKMKEIHDGIKTRDQETGLKTEFQILAGSAGFLYDALQVGAVGGVCAFANIGPQILVQLLDLFKKGEYQAAESLQTQIKLANECVTRRYGVAGLKAAMATLRGYNAGRVRSPLLPLPADKSADLYRILIDAKVLTVANASSDFAYLFSN